MNTLNDATARNVLEKQHQQRKDESTNECKVWFTDFQRLKIVINIFVF